MAMEQRIQKILSHAGVASRRKAETLIEEGKVTVNGKIAKLGDKADPGKNVLAVEGRQVRVQEKLYFALNKPVGYTTTVQDRFERKKVVDLFPANIKVYPVGRLDKIASGLLLMTNDGDFANKVMHPRYEVEKTYLVELERRLMPAEMELLRKGVRLKDGKTWPAKVRELSRARNQYEIIIHEGRHKIVKRMFKAAGTYVRKLIRTQIGPVKLGNLKPGRYRKLSGREIRLLNGDSSVAL